MPTLLIKSKVIPVLYREMGLQVFTVITLSWCHICYEKGARAGFVRS